MIWFLILGVVLGVLLAPAANPKPKKEYEHGK